MKKNKKWIANLAVAIALFATMPASLNAQKKDTR
jgi:hypothetical protein